MLLSLFGDVAAGVEVEGGVVDAAVGGARDVIVVVDSDVVDEEDGDAEAVVDTLSGSAVVCCPWVVPVWSSRFAFFFHSHTRCLSLLSHFLFLICNRQKMNSGR